jgi:hypothetical protein
VGGLWHDSLEQYFRQYLFEVEHIVVRMGRFATFVKVGEKSLCFVNLNLAIICIFCSRFTLSVTF